MMKLISVKYDVCTNYIDDTTLKISWKLLQKELDLAVDIFDGLISPPCYG